MNKKEIKLTRTTKTRSATKSRIKSKRNSPLDKNSDNLYRRGSFDLISPIERFSSKPRSNLDSEIRELLIADGFREEYLTNLSDSE